MNMQEQVHAMSTDELGSAWANNKEKLKDLRDLVEAQERELDRRYFPDVGEKPTAKRAIGNGWELKRTQNTTISVKRDCNTLEKTQAALNGSGDVVEPYFENLFEQANSVKVKKAEYNKLPDDVKREVEKVLTFTRNKPKLELVPPKQKA